MRETVRHVTKQLHLPKGTQSLTIQDLGPAQPGMLYQDGASPWSVPMPLAGPPFSMDVVRHLLDLPHAHIGVVQSAMHERGGWENFLVVVSSTGHVLWTFYRPRCRLDDCLTSRAYVYVLHDHGDWHHSYRETVLVQISITDGSVVTEIPVNGVLLRRQNARLNAWLKASPTHTVDLRAVDGVGYVDLHAEQSNLPKFRLSLSQILSSRDEAPDA